MKIPKKRLLDKIVGEMVDTFFLNSLAVAVNRIEVNDYNIEGPITNDGVYNDASNVTKFLFWPPEVEMVFVR